MRRTLVVLVAVGAGALGCNRRIRSATEGTVSSVILTLRDPAPDALGTTQNPVSVQQATFDLQAVDDRGAPLAVDLDVDLFLSFGGVKVGKVDACGTGMDDQIPLETIHLAGGSVQNHTVALPAAYGPTTLWLDDPVSHATGASPTIYFRNPFIKDVQTPPDLTATNATYCTTFNGKYIIVDQPELPTGQLVVSSVFGNAFAVTDTSKGSYDGFNSIYVYSFGKPPDYIVPGKVLKQFSGNVSKFVGFTELNFPLYVPDNTAPIAALPPPLVVTAADTADTAKVLSAVAGVVSYTGTLCNPSPDNPNNDSDIQNTIDQWQKYNEFVVDGDGTCESFNNFAVQMPAKVLGTFDPLQHVGATVTVIGMLHNSSGRNFYEDADGKPIACSDALPCAKGSCEQGICYKNPYNFWTIYPRSPADVTVQ